VLLQMLTTAIGPQHQMRRRQNLHWSDEVRTSGLCWRILVR